MLHTENNVIILTEQKLLRMQDLDKQIEILQAEYNMLKKQTIEEYFQTASEFTTARGLVLATYTKTEPETFSQSEFKKDHPDYYKMYSKKRVQYTFRLK